MAESIGSLNLTLAWLWITLGTIVGLVLGSFFHREAWLGGYDSLQRRMYRLAHISFFGLGILNLLFFLSLRVFPSPTPLLQTASWALALGAVTMPVCCVLMARSIRFRFLFAVPVLSVLLASTLTLKEVWTL